MGDPQYADIGNVVPFFLAFFFPLKLHIVCLSIFATKTVKKQMR